MRNQVTTGRRIAVVVALMLIAVFVLHPACPPEPSHHGSYTPGLSAELCHHGEAQHLSAGTPTLAAVQASVATLVGLDESAAGPLPVSPAVSFPPHSWHVSSGRALLIDLGISRT